ncbi:MAG: hypothetical protein HRU30_12880 [Rhodobacteraceae bacterium]|nr:hypothetical protein [Paracoccaceae bacterium]
MAHVIPIEVPQGSILHRISAETGAFVDAFEVDLGFAPSLAQVIEAFYSAPAFRIERILLGTFLRTPTSKSDLAALAVGDADKFAVWRVVDRSETTIFLRDKGGRTASWLAVDGTRVRFGSAVYPKHPTRNGPADLGWVFKLLLGFHTWYSRWLLASAAKRLQAVCG